MASYFAAYLINHQYLSTKTIDYEYKKKRLKIMKEHDFTSAVCDDTCIKLNWEHTSRVLLKD